MKSDELNGPQGFESVHSDDGHTVWATDLRGKLFERFNNGPWQEVTPAEFGNYVIEGNGSRRAITADECLEIIRTGDGNFSLGQTTPWPWEATPQDPQYRFDHLSEAPIG